MPPEFPADFNDWPDWAKYRYVWAQEARPEQLPPQWAWNVWLVDAGRGFGKTRIGAEDTAYHGQKNSNWRTAIVAKTFADARDTCVEGESGLLSVLPPSSLRGGAISTAWNRSIGELFLANGSLYKCFASETPGRLRGPQWHRAWCDELADWDSPDAFDMLMLGLRLGAHPQCVVTTTPRPKQIIRDLLIRDDVAVTRGSTFDNAANLSPAFLAQVRERYEGTRLGRQELYAELLDDVPGAYWRRSDIDAHRRSSAPDLIRVVVAIDPAVTSGEDSDETGIAVVGLGVDDRFYVLADLTCRTTPEEWARTAIAGYREWGADRIVGETNNGGDMIEALLRTIDRNIPYRAVTATRGKKVRAEPVSALYEQGRVSHVGRFVRLEDQMVNWVPDVDDVSPDRVDALVWAFKELTEGSSAVGWMNQIARVCGRCGHPNPRGAVACLRCQAPLGR